MSETQPQASSVETRKGKHLKEESIACPKSIYTEYNGQRISKVKKVDLQEDLRSDDDLVFHVINLSKKAHGKALPKVAHCILFDHHKRFQRKVNAIRQVLGAPPVAEKPNRPN